MNASRLFSLTLLAAAIAATATGALAADTGAMSRADVKAVVVQARAHGELMPAGEAVQPFATTAASDTALSRRQVRDETLAARARGELVPAGEGTTMPPVTTETQLARADVRESVRLARLHGELIPAGEGLGPVDGPARMRASRSEIFAAAPRR